MIDKNRPEIFVPIKGYEGLYEISNDGRVKSLERKSICRSRMGRSFTRTIKEKILAFTVMPKGYITVHLSKTQKIREQKTNNILVHRLVAIHFIPNPENKPQVNHKDGIKANNCDWNLEWNTALENSIHSVETGLFCQTGENSSNAKLTKKQVLEIRKECVINGNYLEFAKQYNVTISTIGRIVRKQSWKFT